jgi:diacylglycerol kinase (ATP)
MQTIVIANPKSGSSSAGEQVRERADALGWTWHSTTSEADAGTLAAQASPEQRVIAAGGDGTVHCVLQGLLSRPDPAVLGVLPLGTGNDLARTLGFSLDPAQAIEELTEAHVRSIDVAQVVVDEAARFWINSAAAGLSVEVNRALEPEKKARWGPLAYVLGALDVIGDPPAYDVAVHIDGKLVDHLRATSLVATNGETVGGGLRVSPTADPEDGLLDLLVVEHGPRVALAALGAQLKNGQVLSSPLAHHYLGAHIELRCDPPMPFNLDGEVIGERSSISFHVLPRVIRASIGPGYRFLRANSSIT